MLHGLNPFQQWNTQANTRNEAGTFSKRAGEKKQDPVANALNPQVDQ